MSYTVRPITARNPWLVRPYQNRPVVGVMLHSTRSGVSDGDDGPRTEGWWSNPNNIQGSGIDAWGSYADLLIFEDGTRVVCTDIDAEYATWTAGYGGTGTWAAGIPYVQIEIAQGNLNDPFTPAQIDSLAECVAGLARRYGFPIVRIPYLAQTGTPPRGIATHEDSANGRKSGKTDVGPMFPWDRFLTLAQVYLDGGELMAGLSDEQRQEVIALIDDHFKLTVTARIQQVLDMVLPLQQWREQVVPVIDGHSQLIEAHIRQGAVGEHSHEIGGVVPPQ